MGDDNIEAIRARDGGLPRDLATAGYGEVYEDRRTLLAALYDLRAEYAALAEVRHRGCECSDDDACAFARERDMAQAEVVALAARDDVVRELVLELRAAIATGTWYSREQRIVGMLERLETSDARE